MLTVYKDGKTKEVHGVDDEGWLDEGWSLTATGTIKEPVSLININTASTTELRTIVGVGAAIAKKIEDNRPFSSVEDLEKVDGLNVKAIVDLITF